MTRSIWIGLIVLVLLLLGGLVLFGNYNGNNGNGDAGKSFPPHSMQQ
ncbi:hypothetical protein [Rhizobium paknamense]|uniref:Flagellar basal body-associated protein FliL n=1 Tax=Rhizobium paknamense TaxID=1206817 RepID=A0ABU0IKS6_9HYPH|nr:hypothetical protein [Rhizobium paknamense]MDQ0457851.1 flagellar basal body-associated protein FliL [Rhizobium paknamense]